MKDIKEELLNMVNDINISGLFSKIEEYENSRLIEIKNKPTLPDDFYNLLTFSTFIRARCINLSIRSCQSCLESFIFP